MVGRVEERPLMIFTVESLDQTWGDGIHWRKGGGEKKTWGDRRCGGTRITVVTSDYEYFENGREIS